MAELDRLRIVFRAAFDLPNDADVDRLEYRAIEQWDSLAHLTLVSMIEDEFAVMLDTDAVIDLSSFERAREILRSQGIDC